MIEAISKPILYLLFSFFIASIGFGQANTNHGNRKDTTIVGSVLAGDSIFQVINSSRAGVRYYYGVYHFKIGVIDITDSLIKDTLIIAYVYNMRSDIKDYLNNFKLKINGTYIFDLGLFSPCSSDFPRIEGTCDANHEFFPLSNKLIRHYTTMYRVINTTNWYGAVKRK